MIYILFNIKFFGNFEAMMVQLDAASMDVSIIVNEMWVYVEISLSFW